MVHMNITSEHDLVGAVLNNQYQFLEVLGSGGYGVVYRALDLYCPEGKQYAVKCLERYPEYTPASRAQEREWLIQSLVHDHPNIVTVHTVHVVEDTVFIVFDLCDGGDLFGAITEKRSYHHNDKLTKQAFVQLVDAVQHCHSHGIAHRDLKPENILCSADGTQLFMADFGLATVDEISDRNRVGSRHYMSPECIGKEGEWSAYATRPADVWSLGMILVNMISARGLWKQAIMEDDLYRLYKKDPNLLRDMLSLSKDANKLFKRIFHENPRKRITLPELREAVMKMKTFFQFPDEVRSARPAAQRPAAQPAPQPFPFPVAAKGRRGEPWNDAIMHSVDSREVFPHGDAKALPPSSLPATTNYPFDVSAIPPQPSLSEATLVSAAASATQSGSLPITPESYAVSDAAIAALTQSLSDLAIPGLADVAIHAVKEQVPQRDKLGRSSGSFLRHAMDRLKAL